MRGAWYGREQEARSEDSSGDKVFAPSWFIVMGHKNGDISDEQYTDEYLSMMRRSYRDDRARWQEVVESGSVTLACYCKAGAFCHRIILVDLLRAVGESIGIEVVYEGELT
jgi:uncharacterized protein YeaO (DUF488 family)